MTSKPGQGSNIKDGPLHLEDLLEMAESRGGIHVYSAPLKKRFYISPCNQEDCGPIADQEKAHQPRTPRAKVALPLAGTRKTKRSRPRIHSS